MSKTALLNSVQSEGNEIKRTNTQIEVMEIALQNLRNNDSKMTLILDSGQRITIEKLLEGGTPSNRFLSVTISD